MNKKLIVIIAAILINIICLQIYSEDLQDATRTDYQLSANKKDEPIYIHTPARIIKGQIPTYVKNYLTGEVKDGFKITLVDENRNGKYDDIGKDLILLGTSRFGIPLSNIINIDNKLYDFKIDTTQSKVSLKAYNGKSGMIDLISGYNSFSPLDLIVVKSNNGDYFDVSKSKSFALPSGEYSLYVAYIKDKDGKNEFRIMIKGGKMKKIEITGDDNKVETVKWGIPLRLECQCVIDENKVNIPAKTIKVFGSANEEYATLWPRLLPKVEVKDANGVIVNSNCFTAG
jgi:hypothetical protein